MGRAVFGVAMLIAIAILIMGIWFPVQFNELLTYLFQK